VLPVLLPRADSLTCLHKPSLKIKIQWIWDLYSGRWMLYGRLLLCLLCWEGVPSSRGVGFWVGPAAQALETAFGEELRCRPGDGVGGDAGAGPAP